MSDEKCPQCQTQINESKNRLIQESCGHKKCRECLLQEETGCKLCFSSCELLESNSAIIPYDNNETEIKSQEISKNDCTGGGGSENGNGMKRKKKLVYKSLPLPDHITTISKLPALYKCTICSKSFSTSGSIKYHSYCGGIEKPLKCDICNNGFISNSHLITHKLKHSGARPFQCQICQKSFIQKSKLNRHAKLHTGERPFVCSECGKKFTNKDALIGHCRTHNGDKPFVCKYCGHRFNNKSNLTKHQATHSKDKLYMCEQCGKKFSNKFALVSHRKCHTRERLHSCQKCSKCFTNVKDLRRHGIIHLGTKPYSCKLCSAKFCRKDNLVRHLKNTHSMKDKSAIKSASIKITTNVTNNIKKPILHDSHTTNTETNSKSDTKTTTTTFRDNPNAIHVIKTANELLPKQLPTIRNAVPVINGPFKLAFKTDAFKNNYNIFNREYPEPPPRIQTNKPYDRAESLNICQKILMPTTNIQNENKNNNNNNNNNNHVMSNEKNNNNNNNNNQNVIMSIGKVNEKESLEICKKILQPNDFPPLHYETSFEHKQHAIIKNIKFKLPPTYTNNISKHVSSIKASSTVSDAFYDIESNSKAVLTELQPVELNYSETIVDGDHCNKPSVIVNHHTIDNGGPVQNDVPFNEMHWRRRTLQNLQPK